MNEYHSDRLQNLPTGKTSRSGRRPEENTSATFASHSMSSGGFFVRSYVAEIDRLVELRVFRAGERTRLEVVSSITRLINGDNDLSPQENARSFELYMEGVV